MPKINLSQSEFEQKSVFQNPDFVRIQFFIVQIFPKVSFLLSGFLLKISFSKQCNLTIYFYFQIQRLAREERDMLTQQVNTLSTQVEAQNQVVRKLEEKERLLQNNLAALDKELSMRQQAMEMHKRKAIESAQSAADLKLHLEKYHAQIKEMQQTVAEKTSSLEAEAFKTKRLQEELAIVKRKVERLRKIEMASDMDEILKEEIREYKETLTCPSCKVKRKDAVLTKCFHCFCYDCLRTRYETRQRKCPKCNVAFGASDYHRLFL